MKMMMHSGNPSQGAIYNAMKASNNPVTVNSQRPSSALNGSIIGRIHTVKPGCNSCGK